MSMSLTSSQPVTFTIDQPTTPPSPTPVRLTKDSDTVDRIVPKDSVFSTLPNGPKAASTTPAERRPWPSHSATRAHLPAHADIQVQRNRSPVSHHKHRHVPARLSIMPRSSSGLVLATPTSMTSLTALLESETPLATSQPLSLAAELAQAEASSDSEPEPEPSPELEPEPETPENEPIATFSKQEIVTKDVPPPYSQNVASSVPARGPAAAAAGPSIIAPTALLPAAPIISTLPSHITPIPLSILSARRPSTPMGRLMGAGGSNLSLAALGIVSEPASPFSPGFNENPAVHNGFSRDPTGPLAFLANSQRTLALELVSMALSDDLAGLTDTNNEIDRLRAQLAAKEAEREMQRTKIRGYQSTLDKALVSLEEEKNHLIAMRERLFVTGLKQKDDVARAGQTAQQALNKARGGWCRLWIDC